VFEAVRCLRFAGTVARVGLHGQGLLGAGCILLALRVSPSPLIMLEIRTQGCSIEMPGMLCLIQQRRKMPGMVKPNDGGSIP
jgi:hypothetical protein